MKSIYKTKKIKLLRIIPTLDPSFGGPSFATIESSIILSQKGVKVDIITCDSRNKSFKRLKDIKIINFGPNYLGNYRLNFKIYDWLKKNRDKYDIFIVHGVWTYLSLIARLLIKNKYFIFTHGQLDPFFSKNFLKVIKKKLYWFFFEKSNLLQSKKVLVTSKKEISFSKNTFVNTDGIKFKKIQYGIVKQNFNKKKILSQFYKKFKYLKNKNFYLFLGRYHEKKGCDILIESINNLKNEFNDVILMCGPLENSNYLKNLYSLIKKYNLEKKVILSDAIYGDLKWGAIAESKAMLLASHGENFGVALVESLSLGKPVITTNKVGISDDIIKYKAGIICNDDVESFTRNFKKFINYSKNKNKNMSINAIKCFNSNFNLKSNHNSLFNLLNNELH
jgi:glycosyltransferase involved in cell wall biosynthesis